MVEALINRRSIMTSEIVAIPARSGKAVSIREGQAVKVINTPVSYTHLTLPTKA